MAKSKVINSLKRGSDSHEVFTPFWARGEFHTVLKRISEDAKAVKHVGRNGKRLVELLQEVREKGYVLSDKGFIKG